MKLQANDCIPLTQVARRRMENKGGGQGQEGACGVGSTVALLCHRHSIRAYFRCAGGKAKDAKRAAAKAKKEEKSGGLASMVCFCFLPSVYRSERLTFFSSLAGEAGLEWHWTETSALVVCREARSRGLAGGRSVASGTAVQQCRRRKWKRRVPLATLGQPVGTAGRRPALRACRET